MSSQDRLRGATASAFAIIHDSVAKCAKRMAAEMKRHSYVTPVNYIELVKGYKRYAFAARLGISSGFSFWCVSHLNLHRQQLQCMNKLETTGTNR